MLERRAEERPSKGRMGNDKQLEHLVINKDHCHKQTFPHLRCNHLFASPYFAHRNIKAPRKHRQGYFPRMLGQRPRPSHGRCFKDHKPPVEYLQGRNYVGHGGPAPQSRHRSTQIFQMTDKSEVVCCCCCCCCLVAHVLNRREHRGSSEGGGRH